MAEIVWCLSLLPGRKRVKMSLMAIRRVTVLVFPQVQAIDVFGPVEVFSAADRLAGGGEYAIELVSGRAGSIETSSGVRVLPDRAASAVREPLDTLIVAGGDGVAAALGDRRLIRWVDRVAARSRQVCSVCTGAFQRRVGASPSQYRERFRPALKAA
jgi:transcriptional regulator GlxA family with amidase domain